MLILLASLGLLVLALNALRINGALPDGRLLRTIAPFGATSGAVVLAMTTARMGTGATAARSLVAITGTVLALATVGLATIEIVTNYVFGVLDDAARVQVLAGGTGSYLALMSIGYVLAALAFAAASGMTRNAPAGAAVAVGIGGVMIGLRTFSRCLRWVWVWCCSARARCGWLSPRGLR
ncbi:MAG: hypothetical protein ACK5LS_08425 [Propioniciclava sp.]